MKLYLNANLEIKRRMNAGMLAGIEFRKFIFLCPISLCSNIVMVLREILITLCDNKEYHTLVVGNTNSADKWTPTSLSVVMLLIKKNFLEHVICIYFSVEFYDQILSTRSEASTRMEI
jgi:hypothetical protein